MVKKLFSICLLASSLYIKASESKIETHPYGMVVINNIDKALQDYKGKISEDNAFYTDEYGEFVLDSKVLINNTIPTILSRSLNPQEMATFNSLYGSLRPRTLLPTIYTTKTHEQWISVTLQKMNLFKNE